MTFFFSWFILGRGEETNNAGEDPDVRESEAHVYKEYSQSFEQSIFLFLFHGSLMSTKINTKEASDQPVPTRLMNPNLVL